MRTGNLRNTVGDGDLPMLIKQLNITVRKSKLGGNNALITAKISGQIVIYLDLANYRQFEVVLFCCNDNPRIFGKLTFQPPAV